MHSLREAILSGELSGGVQLKQEELASKFNVSMSALREALKSLEAEGLVKFFPNRGAVVSELSPAEELAIPNLSEADLDAAAQVLQEIDAEVDGKRWSVLNWRFHEILYHAANRPKLLSLIQNLHNNVERYMRLYLATLHYQEKSQAEHRLLLDACGKGDVKAAQKILRKHMTDAKKNLSRYLSR